MAVILDRILDVLECCSEVSEGRSITEISTLIGLHKSTISRLANSLLDRNYLVRDPATKRYKLGVKCVELSYHFLNNLDIRKEAHPIMIELRTHVEFTVFLALQQGHDVVYIDKADGTSGVQRASIIGYRAPMHATALGKALLMQMGDEALQAFFTGYHFKAFTLQTKTTLDAVIMDLHESRSRGYAMDIEENTQGVYCLALPIYDYRGVICASLSVSATKEQWKNRKEKDIADWVAQAAMTISHKLGYINNK
ncbi:IclR family transcriptional regulator [Entomospira nematocerorum]|uniref:IclR family transcriptional regulator n=1 Tax=Entomospira nematocerorum TaxID=2719987 RepID=A0A968GB13_9SPIO|nr:IclR family transcriptional regulator [Entomospira nematocera]NIZ46499.1 IclR family transcriptional regulator [Entomospira nematocera]WDI33700.1 IclR family transcriptional regulator [Entomospira nematocera]